MRLTLHCPVNCQKVESTLDLIPHMINQEQLLSCMRCQFGRLAAWMLEEGQGSVFITLELETCGACLRALLIRKALPVNIAIILEQSAQFCASARGLSRGCWRCLLRVALGVSCLAKLTVSEGQLRRFRLIMI